VKPRKQMTPLTRNNRKFFLTFYNQYKNFLVYIADKFVEDPEDRADLVQESLSRLMKNITVLRQLNRSQTAKYIELTVKTAFLDMEKLACREKMLVLDNAVMEALLDLKNYAERETEKMEAKESVGRLRRELTQREWLALEGKYILGYSYQELRLLLDMDQEALRGLLYRVKRKAARILQEEEENA